jgi:hypothetical protein
LFKKENTQVFSTLQTAKQANNWRFLPLPAAKTYFFNSLLGQGHSGCLQVAGLHACKGRRSTMSSETLIGIIGLVLSAASLAAMIFGVRLGRSVLRRNVTGRAPSPRW